MFPGQIMLLTASVLVFNQAITLAVMNAIYAIAYVEA